MVEQTNKIKTKEGKSFKLKQRLNCRNFGIYAASCTQCREIYVGQTVNSYSKRWNQHRYQWNLCYQEETPTEENLINKDEKALYIHYRKKHRNFIEESNLQLQDAFKITFLESPPASKLDSSESDWISKLNAQINIAKTFLPKIR